MTTAELFSLSESYQCKNKQEEDLLEKLKTLKCHYTWKYDTARSIEERIYILQGKKTGLKTNDSKIQLNQICYYCREIQLGFYESLKSMESASESFNKASNILNSVSKQYIKNGMLYVLECDQLFAKFLCCQFNECTVEKIAFLREQFEKFGILERSVIMGIYAVSLMGTGIHGCITSVDLLRKLCIMDPSTFEWPLRLGMALMRIREEVDPMQLPSEEEMYNFRVAVSLTSITENSSSRPLMYHIKSTVQAGKTTPNTLQASMDELGKALSRGTDSEIRIQFMEAIMHHPDFYSDENISKIVDEMLKDNSNNYIVNFIAGMFFKKSSKHYTRALYYLEKADKMALKSHTFQLEISIIDLKFHMNTNQDTAISALTELLERYGSNHEKRRIILCLRGAFHLLKRNECSTIFDWIEARGHDRQAYQVAFLKTLLNSTAVLGDPSKTSSAFIRLIGNMKKVQAGNIQKIFFKELVALFKTIRRIAHFNKDEFKFETFRVERQQAAQNKKGKKSNQTLQQNRQNMPTNSAQGRNQPQNQGRGRSQQNQGWTQPQQIHIVAQNLNNQQSYQSSSSSNVAIIPIRINLDEFRTKIINIHVHSQCKSCNGNRQ